MVPRFAKAGRSFAGVAQYLLHDAGHAATSERVAWTHVLNCAHEDVPGAVREMISTWRNAEVLKAEAGVRGGGKTDKPVKHLSLNWHPSEVPDREAMIAAAEGFLTSMGWQRHQAVLIAHTDRAHRHVHIVLSAIDPETGRKIDDRLEFRRAQKWAAGYERERGQEFCPQRNKPAAEREASPTRPVWQILEESLAAHRQAEAARLAGMGLEAEAARSDAVGLEWTALKQMQREAREAFFADGRKIYGAARDTVHRAVKKELRPEWRDLYAAARAGADRGALQASKEALIERQMTMLREGVAAACKPLRLDRDLAYRALLDAQKEERALLHAQQARGTPAAGTLGALAESARKAYAPELERFRSARGKGKSTGARDLPPEQAPRWSERGGMVAQQRSARRWLDRIAARNSVAPKPEADTSAHQVRSRLYMKSPGEKPAAQDQGSRKEVEGPEPGPD